MTMKSLLLGAAAGLVTVGAAQAADLPMTKAEPVEYVKICSEFGEGFFYIPGTDTCLKIAGEVRADYKFDSRDGRADDVTAFRAEPRLKFDARTATEYGTLRSYIQLNAPYEARSASIAVDKAFIQFGGLTAGKAHSFFGMYDLDYASTIFSGYYGPQGDADLLAYTAVFGGGFSTTLSLEDGRDHRGIMFETYPDGNGITTDLLPYGGQSIPDIVGNLRVDQPWGEAQLSGAVHEMRFNSNNFSDNPDAKYGWAVAAGVGVKLPFASGAHFAIEGAYASGASKYLGLGNAISSPDYNLDGKGDGVSVDAVWNDVNAVKPLRGWSVTGELGVDFTPSISATAFASYVNASLKDYIEGFDADFHSYILGANAWYTIVPGLKAGAEVSYQKDKLDLGGVKTDPDEIAGGVRIVRTF